MVTCKICNRKINSELTHDGFNHLYDCQYCGKYKYAMSYEPDTYPQNAPLYKISSWIREQNDLFNNIPLLDNEKFDEVLAIKDKKIKEKFDLMMEFLSKITSRFNQTEIDKLIVKCWMKDENEFFKLYEKAKDLNFIRGSVTRTLGGGGAIVFQELTFEGIEYVENLENVNINSKNIFVAFNFTPEIIEIFENDVRKSIEEIGFNYTIVNQQTTPHDQKITDEIIAKIKSSRMIIADFTNNSTNVYFEAGFAMGLKIPVIWTCKKGHKFSFDTGQFPHITWEYGEDLAKQIKNRVLAIL